MIGKVGPFEEGDDEWEHYVERLAFYFTANKIDDKKQKPAVLLIACGAKTYKLIRRLLAPAKPDAVDYQNIVDKVKDHLNPKPSCILLRFRINSRNQRDGESIQAFVAELRLLSEDCEFGETLPEMLRDRLVCGVSYSRIQTRLLQKGSLSFDEALKIARVMEAAERNSEEIRGPTTTLEAAVH